LLAPLLSEDEAPPCEMTGHGGPAPFVIGCDHAGRAIPRSLGTLGLSPQELASHVAWDIGAGEVARQLAAALGAVAFCQRYSRLVVDCNRPLDAPDSIVTRSERVVISGNEGIGRDEAEARARAVFHPYHEQIRSELDRRKAAGRPSLFIAVHSFTPVFLDIPRPWHAGVLYNRDARLAERLLELLEREGDLVVGRNEPYAASELTDYSLVTHAERRDIPCVELELRQDLIADADGQRAWAMRLARLLPEAARALYPG
jgi:predicted N-formylglutamate amidohydrolase